MQGVGGVGDKQTEPLSLWTVGKLRIPLRPACCYSSTSFCDCAVRFPPANFLLYIQPLLLCFSAVLLSSCFFILSTMPHKFSFFPIPLPVLTPVTHSPPATFQPLLASCLSQDVWAEVDRAGCSISVSACLCSRRRRLSGPLSADQHRCRWEVKSSLVTGGLEAVANGGGMATLPSVPLHPLWICLLCFCVHLSFQQALSLSLPPAFSPLLLQQQGWSGLWQSAGIDRWTELETGWEDGWGQGREFNTGKHRETERNDLLGYSATHSPTAI